MRVSLIVVSTAGLVTAASLPPGFLRTEHAATKNLHDPATRAQSLSHIFHRRSFKAIDDDQSQGIRLSPWLNSPPPVFSKGIRAKVQQRAQDVSEDAVDQHKAYRGRNTLSQDAKAPGRLPGLFPTPWSFLGLGKPVKKSPSTSSPKSKPPADETVEKPAADQAEGDDSEAEPDQTTEGAKAETSPTESAQEDSEEEAPSPESSPQSQTPQSQPQQPQPQQPQPQQPQPQQPQPQQPQPPQPQPQQQPPPQQPQPQPEEGGRTNPDGKPDRPSAAEGVGLVGGAMMGNVLGFVGKGLTGHGWIPGAQKGILGIGGVLPKGPSFAELAAGPPLVIGSKTGRPVDNGFVFPVRHSDPYPGTMGIQNFQYGPPSNGPWGTYQQYPQFQQPQYFQQSPQFQSQGPPQQYQQGPPPQYQQNPQQQQYQPGPPPQQYQQGPPQQQYQQGRPQQQQSQSGSQQFQPSGNFQQPPAQQFHPQMSQSSGPPPQQQQPYNNGNNNNGGQWGQGPMTHNMPPQTNNMPPQTHNMPPQTHNMPPSNRQPPPKKPSSQQGQGKQNDGFAPGHMNQMNHWGQKQQPTGAFSAPPRPAGQGSGTHSSGQSSQAPKNQNPPPSPPPKPAEPPVPESEPMNESPPAVTEKPNPPEPPNEAPPTSPGKPAALSFCPTGFLCIPVASVSPTGGETVTITISPKTGQPASAAPQRRPQSS